MERIISDADIPNFSSIATFSEKAHQLFLQQISTWDLAKKNYSDLESIQKKKFSFGNQEIVVQFNPGRIISSAAKVDAKSIKERPCFLCSKNLPEEQKGIVIKNEYLLLVNPFPIFKEHFTIPKLTHEPQSILPNFPDMLSITEELKEKYSLFYNGPKCGASAPDHMHFQASPFSNMPVEYQFSAIKSTAQNLSQKKDITILKVSNYLRNFWILESTNKETLISSFEKLYKILSANSGNGEEPLLNIIATYSDGWRIFIFPRKAHRPKEYFYEGDDKILISPAAVDFGGIFITPREEDFNKLSENDIINIFAQTTIDNKMFDEISNQIAL